MNNLKKLSAIFNNFSKLPINRINSVQNLKKLNKSIPIYNLFRANTFSLQSTKNENNNSHFSIQNSNSVEHSSEVKNHYEKVANETLESLSERFDILSEELGDSASKDFDASFSNGVLNINLGDDLGMYVLNKQTPNLQIWLSSPVSGPKRFDFESNTWIYKRTGESLHELLSKELTECYGRNIDFTSCSHGKPQKD